MRFALGILLLSAGIISCVRAEEDEWIEEAEVQTPGSTAAIAPDTATSGDKRIDCLAVRKPKGEAMVTNYGLTKTLRWLGCGIAPKRTFTVTYDGDGNLVCQVDGATAEATAAAHRSFSVTPAYCATGTLPAAQDPIQETKGTAAAPVKAELKSLATTFDTTFTFTNETSPGNTTDRVSVTVWLKVRANTDASPPNNSARAEASNRIVKFEVK